MRHDGKGNSAIGRTGHPTLRHPALCGMMMWPRRMCQNECCIGCCCSGCIYAPRVPGHPWGYEMCTLQPDVDICAEARSAYSVAH